MCHGPYAPGERHAYEKNITYALIGYLVERISGEAFPDYCRWTLFEPLRMESASWFLGGMDSTRVARHCARREDGTLAPPGTTGGRDTRTASSARRPAMSVTSSA